MSGASSAVMFPVLRYRDARAMIQWLHEAFGFAAGMVMPETGDEVAHAELFLGDGGVILGSAPADAPASGAINPGLYVVVPESHIAAHHAQAAASSAEITRALESTDYGSREYTARDPEGTVWTFGTYVPQRP